MPKCFNILCNYEGEEWMTKVKNKPKLRTYIKLKTELKCEKYVNMLSKIIVSTNLYGYSSTSY